MTTKQEQIEKLKNEHAQKLEEQIKALSREYDLRAQLPASVNHLIRLYHGHTAFNDSYSFLYNVKSVRELVQVLQAFRASGAFLPIRCIKKSCTVVHAYLWDEYLAEFEKAGTSAHVSNDAIEVNDSAGRGFSSSKIIFYPVIGSERLKIYIEFDFMHGSHLFAPHVYCDYDRFGNPKRESIKKVSSKAAGFRSWSVSFGGGSVDSLSIVSVGTFENFMAYLTKNAEELTQKTESES